jgi:hypothetical protein
MFSADHAHDFKAFDSSCGNLHRLKAWGGANELFECAMVGLDDSVQVLEGSIFCTSRQPVLNL